MDERIKKKWPKHADGPFFLSNKLTNELLNEVLKRRSLFRYL